MAASQIWRWSAVETAEAIRSGKVSSEEVTRAHIERMHAVNPAINAVVVDLSDQALATARAADEARASGAELGSLHGVPVTVKINIDLEGQANSNGVAALGNLIAPGDSPITANLKAAGAVILGMTNTPEFSLRAFTDNPLHGLTLNPWDPAITCGGSSGGAGASIAMGIGTLAHGNDIGGSLRWPAFCNGVATIKATQGRMPAFNPSATAERPLIAQLMSTQGPLARSIADVRLGLEVMSRRDVRDPWQVPAPLEGPPVKRPLRVALARIPDDMETDPQVMALVRRAADWLADAGYAVEEVEIPDIGETWKLWQQLISTEIAVMQREAMVAMGSPAFVQALDGILNMGPLLDGEGYMRAIANRTRLMREWLLFLEERPLILTPLSVKRTPKVNADLDGDAAVKAIFWNDLRFVGAVNVVTLPAAVVPVGLVDGHPVGVQIIGSRYREDLCLEACAAIETRAGILVQQLWAREG